ncbi:MAG: DUF4810 domain-containing protein [Moraxellaceae bacterium]|nr:MAG: DUF4810 domain-containing protein [Moraxellaceae bacterium]
MVSLGLKLFYKHEFCFRISKKFQADKAGPQQQIAALEKDIQKTKAASQAVPPGLYAHLGYEYSLTGNNQKAREYLELEKQVYPESTVYIDRLLQRMN